ncbi:MAG: chemotaxis protein CheX [Fibrobacteres bacterium]|nr:chemotaxis protein CheX [Fibrobacterota bacterium]
MNAIVVSENPFGDDLKEILTKNGCNTIQCIKSIGLAETKLSGPKNLIIYELAGNLQEEMKAVREIMNGMHSERVKILLLLDQGIKDAIATLVNYENVKYVFKPVTKERLQIGLRMLLFEKKQPPKLSIEYINPFIEATTMILKQMAFTDITKKDVNVENGLSVRGDLSGVMALSGKANGFVVISMSFDTAFEIVNKMTMGGLQKDEDRIIEGGVMELINIISGQSQSMFNQNQYHFDFTTPTMIKGKGHSIYHGAMANSIVVRFETQEKSEIYLQICLKNAVG